MDRAFQRVLVRSAQLGNPARKYISSVERNGARLLRSLEEAGLLAQVHLDRTAPTLAGDFDLVTAAGRDPADTLALLGTYFAIQFLHRNALSMERLAVDLAEKPGRSEAYADFLKRAEDDVFRLAGTYIRRVLRVVDPALGRIPYLLCAVGTRIHQDDVDVLVLDDGGPRRPVLDRAFSRLASQMLRHASPLDNYVAEQLGARGFCMSIEELKRGLRSRGLDFVVVTELLCAERIAGSPALYRRFQDEVTSEYHHLPGKDGVRHELYLRALLGESRSLLLRPPQSGSVHPKDEGLRLIRSLSTALKVVLGLPATQPHEILRMAEARAPDLGAELQRLRESFVFLETFFHIVQLVVSVEEQIQVEGSAARENLGRVARAMGYSDRGSLRAADHMLVHYYEAVGAAHAATPAVLEALAGHLESASRIGSRLREVGEEGPPVAVARELAVWTRAFRGARFWDDVLGSLSDPDGRVLQAFDEDFASLPPARRRRLAAHYADWGRDAPYSLLTLLTLLSERGRPPGAQDPAREIRAEFVRKLGTRSEDIRSIARVFRFYPDLMNRFLLTAEPGELDRLREVLDVQIGDPEVATARSRLDSVAQVHRETSRYVKRVLARLTVRQPATVLALPSDAALRTLAHGRLAASERHPRPEESKGLLGDYYDMEFLRIALGTLRGERDARTRQEFTELTRAYLSGLLDVCLRQAERESGSQLLDLEGLGVYLAGGNAWGRPYDEDYDLLVILDSRDRAERILAERTVVLMNRQIARRGVIAQYRLGDRLGRHVTTMDELVTLLEAEEDDLFVDRCQLLGSCLLAGGHRVEESLERRVLRPHIMNRCAAFVARAQREIRERREALQPAAPGRLHLKEMPGGFRDMDLCLAAALARVQIRMRSLKEAYQELIRLDPDRTELYEILRASTDFLVAVRSAYRVSVVASDVLEMEFLVSPARILGYGSESGEEARQRLFRDVEAHTRRAARAVDRLMEVRCPPMP